MSTTGLAPVTMTVSWSDHTFMSPFTRSAESHAAVVRT
jgi:hypothetical protein